MFAFRIGGALFVPVAIAAIGGVDERRRRRPINARAGQTATMPSRQMLSTDPTIMLRSRSKISIRLLARAYNGESKWKRGKE